MNTDEIRKRFLKFFEERGHKIFPSDSLIPKDDPTLLFTGAGMNQFKEAFLGNTKGMRRAVSCQKCLRTADLEKVGNTPDHHTFFEMLGNFSFGDYFKEEAIQWAWEFLTEDLRLNQGDLWVSIYNQDHEGWKIWKDKILVPEEKILRFDESQNFWPSNAPKDGPNGPCGPCSEIFFGGPDGIEVWNLVFTQFDRRDGGVLEDLPSKNIDTGMGLERIARVMQGKKTNFDIDIFVPIVEAVKEIADFKTRSCQSQDLVLNREIFAIADHIRAISFAICDGVLPSNEERGYVIRKLIRKAFWYGRSFGLEKPFLYKIVPTVAKVMKESYPELTEQREDISQVVLEEEKRFKNTIKEGLNRLNEMLTQSRGQGVLSGEDVFKLYDTYGFPLELTQEIVRDRNIKVDLEGFENCMKQQRKKSKEGSKIKEAIFSDNVAMQDSLTLAVTQIEEDEKPLTTTIVQIVVGDKVKDEIKEGEGGAVFLQATNFYGEKGGQVGDTGELLKDGREIAEVTNAIDIAGRVQHLVKMKKDTLKRGDIVTVKLNRERRENIRKNHTATHLLHSALRKVLGPHVKQAGSLVAPDRLRFDFNHFKALTDAELSRVEEIVNQKIMANIEVRFDTLTLKEAEDRGALAFFGEKYGDKVIMVSVGDFSKELCGGTHVKNTGEIRGFKIISESSIASGVRRIEALTGESAHKKIQEDADLIQEIAKRLKTTPDNILKEIEKITTRLKQLEISLEEFSKKSAQSSIEKLLKDSKEINGIRVITGKIENVGQELLLKHSDIIKDRLKKEKGIFVLTSQKYNMTYMVIGTNNLLKEEQIRLDASKLLNKIGADFGLKGGGREDLAQAGGVLTTDLDTLIKKTEEIIEGLIKR